MNKKALFVVIVAALSLIGCQQPAVPKPELVLPEQVSSKATLRAQSAGGFSAVATTSNFTCALTDAGGVKCWGSINGQSVPTTVSGLTSGVQAIAAGGSHACALTNVGAVKCWGANNYGQLGNNTFNNGGNFIPVDVNGLSSGVQAISAGASHTCAISVGGAAKCWGANYWGQLGNNSTTYSPIPTDVSGLNSGVQQISAGPGHTCAVTSTGGITCWGVNGAGQLGNNSTATSLIPVGVIGLGSGVQAVTTGGAHTCALTVSGGVKCWGFNYSGQLGNNSTISSPIPLDVTGLSSGVQALAASNNAHTCVITNVGGVKCWGYNVSGQLGNNTTVDSPVPVDVSGLNVTAQAIATGFDHTCILTSTGGIKCWGSGPLGNDTTTGSLIPVDVVNPDTTPPIITPTINGTLGSNGWYTSDVTLSWAVVDNESAISASSHCETVVFNADTVGTVINCSATSTGGTSSYPLTIKLDKTAPTVTVTGVSAGASYAQGSVPVAACGTADTVSGLLSTATITTSNSGGLGIRVSTCTGAVDNAGNAAGPVSVTYTVVSSTPASLISALSAQVTSSALPKHLKNALVSRLNEAQVALTAGRKGVAANAMRHFVWFVISERWHGRIGGTLAVALITQAQAILVALGTG
jgi:alpha-tubulin suppressor-like RCC1 family protein